MKTTFSHTVELQKLKMLMSPSRSVTRSTSWRSLSTSVTLNRRRNYYIKGGSNQSKLTPEVRDLIRNVRTPINVDDWNIGPGLQEPIKLDLKPPEDIDDDQTPPMVYWPHKGQEIDKNYQRSPVFLVKRVKSTLGQPYWHKQTLGLLGLGEHAPYHKMVIVPNMPSMNYKLFGIKHLIEIIPLSFPNGFPSDDEFDPKACRITHKGEFVYHPKLKADPRALEQKSAMKLTAEMTKKEAEKNWFKPMASPLGNYNYYRDTQRVNPDQKEYTSDPTYIAKYSESERK